MLGRIIRLAVAALLLLAAWRTGQAFLAHYQFSDEVDGIAQRGVRVAEDDVRSAVLEAAGRYAIPVSPEQVALRAQGEHLYIDIRYTRGIEIFPRYTYPWAFAVSAHGWDMPTGGLRRQPPAP